MHSDLRVGTERDSALVLLDDRQQMSTAARSQTYTGLVELHVRRLGETARAFDGIRGI